MSSDHVLPPAVALPAARRPAPSGVRASVSSGTSSRGREEATTEQHPQVGDPARPDAVSALNRRDLQVLSCLAHGGSTAQVASTLCVSRNTARTRIRRVQGKLDVADRGAAVQAVQDLGVLTTGPGRRSSR